MGDEGTYGWVMKIEHRVRETYRWVIKVEYRVRETCGGMMKA